MLNSSPFYTLYTDVSNGLVAVMLAWLRIAPVFFFMPFLSTKLLSGAVVKNSVILCLCIGLWPFYRQGAPLEKSAWLMVMLYELTIGLCMAFFLCLPFLVANIIGELMDNQRGATISDTIDPANGIESSELSVLLNYIICMIFLSQGGLLQIVSAFADSYRLLPFAQGFSSFDPQLMGRWLNQLITQGIILCSPILFTLFICEVALGIYSRFCQQLNAFSLSLSIKSLVAFSVFLLYFQHQVPTILLDMVDISPLGHMITPANREL